MDELLNNHIELDIVQSELDKERIVNGIYLPGEAYGKNNATTTAIVKNITTELSNKTGVNIGDRVMVDRWAIIQLNKYTKNYKTFINIKSVLGVCC